MPKVARSAPGRMLFYVLTRGAGQMLLLQTHGDYEPPVLAGGSARTDADAYAGLTPRAQPLVHGPVVPAAGAIGLLPSAQAVVGALSAYDGIRRASLPMKDSPAARAILKAVPKH